MGVGGMEITEETLAGQEEEPESGDRAQRGAVGWAV